MALGEEFSNTPLVKVNGEPLSADLAPLLTSASVDDSAKVPDLFVLRFADESGTVLSKGSIGIGTKVEVSVQTTKPGGPMALLAGEVTAMEVEVGEGGMHTVVRGLDQSHRLFRGTRVEAYPNMSASDIVRKVAQRAGLPVGKVEPTAILDHTTQDAVSDWEFLARLAAENDRILTMTDGRLDFVPRSPASAAPGGKQAREDPFVLERGVNLISLRGTVTADGQVDQVQVRGWDPEVKAAVVAPMTAATGSARSDSPGIEPRTLAGKFNAPPYVVGQPTIHKQHQARAVASALADHLAGGFAELEGTARGNPRLHAGSAVTLTGVGAPFSGKYVLTSTRHEFSREFGYRTHFTASNASERSLFGTATATSHPRSRISGVVPALVTSLQDPQHQGRVKIKLPWLSDSYESWWARTVQPGAGKDRGAVVLPEVNDEVLVAFEQGDLGHPYILGGLYNGVDKPKGGWEANTDGTAGQVIRRGIVGRTGMRVELLEKAGQESLQISTNDGVQKITLNQRAKGIEILSEGPCTVKAKQNVEVSTGMGNITLKGTNVTIEAQANLELKGATVKAVGQAAAEISATGVTTVKGAMVKIN